MANATLPVIYNFTVFRGTTPPFVVRLKNPDGTPLTINDLRLSLALNGAALFRRTLFEAHFVLTDALQGEYTYTFSGAETRQFPVGQRVDYELEVRIGLTQQVYLVGQITGAGGLNDD